MMLPYELDEGRPRDNGGKILPFKASFPLGALRIHVFGYIYLHQHLFDFFMVNNGIWRYIYTV